MSSPANWNGEFPPEFVADLPRFSGGRNSADRTIVGIPGLVNVVFAEYLDRSLAARYQLQGEALEQAKREVMRQIRPDLAPPLRVSRGAIYSALRDPNRPLR